MGRDEAAIASVGRFDYYSWMVEQHIDMGLYWNILDMRWSFGARHERFGMAAMGFGQAFCGIITAGCRVSILRTRIRDISVDDAENNVHASSRALFTF